MKKTFRRYFMKNNFYNRKIFIVVFAVSIFFLVYYMNQMRLRQNEEQNFQASVPTETSTPKPTETNTPTPTLAPTINDLELYFDNKSIEITSKEQKKTVTLYLCKNDFKGAVEFDVDLTGNGNFDIDSSEWEMRETGIYILRIDFSGLENGTSYLTMSVKGTDIKSTLEIIVNMPIPENVLYEDDYVKICFDKIGKKGVEFLVENKTEYLLTIQADAIAINGYSTDGIIMSDDVAPKSKGKVIAQCDDFVQETVVEKISGQLRIIDFSYELLERSYKAKFTDVEIE